MADSLQMNLMFDVTAFGIFRAKKFSPCWHVIKKRAHLDLSPGRFTAIAHDVDLAAIDDDLASGNRTGLSRSQAKSRHTGNTGQCFASKSQCGYGLQIGSRPNLARGMSLERKQRVIAIHAAAVIDHPDQRNSPATNHDVYLASACVDTVFDQLLYDGRRTLHDFAGCHLAGHYL